MLFTGREWPLKVFMRFPVYTLHTPILQFIDPDAKYSPLGENTTLVIGREAAKSVLMSSPVDTLHIPIV